MRDSSTPQLDIPTSSRVASPQNVVRSNSTQCPHVPKKLNLRPLNPVPLQSSEGRDDTWSHNRQRSRKVHGRLLECISAKRDRHASLDNTDKIPDRPRTVRIKDKPKHVTVESGESQSRSKANKADHKKQAKKDKTEAKLKKSSSGGIAWGWDPGASILTSGERSSLETIDRREEYATTPRVNPLRRRLDQKRPEGVRYGIERGGPGREGFFSYGSLEGLRKANAGHCENGGLRR